MKRIFITIYLLLLVSLLTIPFTITPMMEAFFEVEITEADQDISRGTFFLISERLMGLDQAGQREALEQLQPQFGYPLGLYKLSEVNVKEKYREDFYKGRIIEERDEEMLVKRLGDSDMAMAMGGPFPGENLDFKAALLFLVAFMLFLTIPALAWTFFLIRDVKKIKASTTRFTSGDHDARVVVSKISSLTEIAQTFNTMAQNTQKLIASQKDLANSVSHEIRTPLARIKFSLEMAGDGIGPESNPGKGDKDYMGEIGKDVEEIESLVDEMLTYARFEREPETSGRLSSHEMVSWLRALVSHEQESGSGKEVEFHTGTDHLIVRFEPVYLGWAVRNLLRNGVRYARTKVTMGFESHRNKVYIQVDDDGPGVPESDREKIFQPFFRLDQSRSRTSGGYGLGLAIAKRITLWHRGTITVGQASSGGARFTLMLPVDLENSDSEKSEPGLSQNVS